VTTIPSSNPAESSWEESLSGLLTELSAVQDELLSILADKRRLLVRADAAGLDALRTREEQVVARLEECHGQRGSLLHKAQRDGLPSDSLRSLSRKLPDGGESRLQPRFQQASQRGQLLRHQSLTNWVLAQRSLIHLAQLLEIIATGGRTCPTYEKGAEASSSGSLVDQAI
jgi:flagellar biosynthesis/type III secretory pathway chaperone